MSAAELVTDIETQGVVLVPHGDRVRFRPKNKLPVALFEELKARKPEVLSYLQSRGWPPESLDCEWRFGKPQARLYPFLGKTVSTPMGPGTLLQVLSVHAAVKLDNNPDRATFFDWQDVRPPGRHISMNSQQQEN